MTLKCDFIAVPRIILNEKDLSSTDKIVMGLITSLTLKNNYCFASNKYLSETLNISKRTLNYSLFKLKNKDLIIIKTDNNTRKIYLNKNNIMKNIAIYSEIDCNTTIENNCNYNKKDNYNKKNNIPYWMEHPEVCKPVSTTESDRKELENLLK